MGFTGAADRVDASGGFGQGETRPQAFTGLNGKGYLIGRTQDRIIEISDISDPDTSTYVSAIIGNPNSMAAHNGSLYVFIGQDLIRFDTPFSDTDTGTDVFTTDHTPRALTSDGTNLYYVHQFGALNWLYRIDDLDSTPTVENTGRIGSSANIRGLVWHDGFFWGVDATSDRLVKIILTTDDSGDPHTLENVGSFSQFVGPITNPQGFGIVNGVGYVSALDNDGSLWELDDFKFTDTIADQSWTVGTAVSVSAPATEDGETPITYAISPALPAGVTLDTSTGGISGTSTETTDATDYTLTATDNNGIEATTTFSASVAASGDAVNNAPSFQDASYSFSDVAISVNTVVGTVAATDADDDTLSYSLTGTDAGDFSIDSDGEITVATELTHSDTYSFNVVADDGTDTTSVVVTVIAIAAAVVVTPTLGWEVPSETVGNTFSATLTSNVALDAAPTVGDLRLRDDDNSDPIVSLNSANTTITTIAGTNNYLIEVELTGTYDGDYTIRINGNTVEYNGAYVNAAQLASAVFSIDSSIGANNAPSFSESSYSFTNVAIGVNTVVGTVAATDADNDTLSYSLTGTDADKFDIDADGEITVAEALDYGESYTINVVANDATDTASVGVSVNTETVSPRAPSFTVDSTTEDSATITITAGDDGGEAVTDWEYELDGGGTWNSFGSTDLQQTIDNLDPETDYSIKVRGVNSEGNGVASAAVTATTDTAPVADLATTTPDALTHYKKALNKTTTPAEAGDNDYSTWATATVVTLDIRDDDDSDQTFDTIFVKCSGVDSYIISVDGTDLDVRTVPDAIVIENAYPEIDDVSITRDGWQHDMIEIAEQTGSSVVLTFSGTDIRVNEVLILRKSLILNSNYASISHSKVDISSELLKFASGAEQREIVVGRDTLRWMSSCSLEFTYDDDDYEVFLDWIDDNPNAVVAQNPELYPWRVYKMVFPDMRHNAPYICSVSEVGNVVSFRLLENRLIGSDLAAIRKTTFNNEDSQDKYLFFNDCVHLDNERVTKTNGSIDYNASDNNFDTYSEETTLQFDTSQGTDGTKITHIFLKSTGVTSFAVQTLVSSTWTTQETLATTQKAYRGWDNSLEKLTTAITETSVRLVFTGTNIKISEVMLLEHAGGLVSIADILPIKVDRTSVVHQTQDGEIKRVKTELPARVKWQLDFSAAFGYNNTHKLEDFLDWINWNPNFTFAERPSDKPWRIYPAGFLNSEFNATFITQTVQIGELVSCQLSER